MITNHTFSWSRQELSDRFEERLPNPYLLSIECYSRTRLARTFQSSNNLGVFRSNKRRAYNVHCAFDVLSVQSKNQKNQTPRLKSPLRSAVFQMQHDVKEIAVFGAASEGFSRKNIGCSMAESLERFEDVVSTALDHGIKVRGYISCVCGCPYDGAVSPQDVAKVCTYRFRPEVRLSWVKN